MHVKINGKNYSLVFEIFIHFFVGVKYGYATKTPSYATRRHTMLHSMYNHFCSRFQCQKLTIIIQDQCKYKVSKILFDLGNSQQKTREFGVQLRVYKLCSWFFIFALLVQLMNEMWNLMSHQVIPTISCWHFRQKMLKYYNEILWYMT